MTIKSFVKTTKERLKEFSSLDLQELYYAISVELRERELETESYRYNVEL